jgi:hypothetical protein
VTDRRRGARGSCGWDDGGDHFATAAAALEIAIGKTQARDRAAEALVAGPVEIETGIEQRSLHVGADAVILGVERAGRQMHEARIAAAHAHDARDRTVGEDASGTGRALKAVEREQLAGDEMAGLLGIQRLGNSGGDEGHGRQYGSSAHEHLEFTPR